MFRASPGTKLGNKKVSPGTNLGNKNRSPGTKLGNKKVSPGTNLGNKNRSPGTNIGNKIWSLGTILKFNQSELTSVWHQADVRLMSVPTPPIGCWTIFSQSEYCLKKKKMKITCRLVTLSLQGRLKVKNWPKFVKKWVRYKQLLSIASSVSFK